MSKCVWCGVDFAKHEPLSFMCHELQAAKAALAAAERRAEQAERERDAAIDWAAGLLVEVGATQSQVDAMRDHVWTKILGANDKP
jgi:hypothetical protein